MNQEYINVNLINSNHQNEKKVLTEEECRDLIAHIIDYMCDRCNDWNYSDEQATQIPADFCYTRYIDKTKKDEWDPQVFCGKMGLGGQWTVKVYDPELAEKIDNLSYEDFLILEQELIKTGIFEIQKHTTYRNNCSNIQDNFTYFVARHVDLKNYSTSKNKSL